MDEQGLLDRYATMLGNPETKEAYLFDGKLFIKREYRDARELQTRITYHKVELDNKINEDNMIPMGQWAKVRKTGKQIK